MMIKVFLIVSSVFVLSLAVPRKFRDISGVEPFIVNGTDAKIEEFPFLVSLQYIINATHSYHSCGGSILNDRWILTAAHCIEDELPESYHVEYATTVIANGYNGVKTADAEQLIWHEAYDWRELNDDIGLVKVKTALQIDLFDFKIRLPVRGEYISTGTPAVLAGWGRIGTNMDISTVLQKVDLQIYSSYDCAQIHNPGWVFYDNICAGVPGGGKGQCNGDSGGPLMVGGIQVGIVSWSMKPCTIAPYPGVFTAVASYIDWIERNSELNLRLGMFLQSRA